MKLFLALIICALAFSGYSAASHAMGLEKASFILQMQEDGIGKNAQDSTDHAQKHDKSGKGFCMDCAHCCAASIVTPVTAAWKPFPILTSLSPSVPHFQPENRLFSLLRPPKTLA